jgi:putative addiction module antidote
MVKPVNVRQVGGSVGTTIPKDMAERLHLEPGDKLLAVETQNGILLTPYDPDVEAGMQLARKLAKKYRNALRELAR